MTHTTYARDEVVLPVLIADRAAHFPDEVLLVDVQGGSMTYAELHERSLAWARVLMAAGVDTGSTVATLLHNTVENYAIWFGIAWAGAVEVPVNVDLRGNVLTHQLNTAAPAVVIADASALPHLDAVAPSVTGFEQVTVVQDGQMTAEELQIRHATRLLSEAPPEPQRAYAELYPWDIASVMYTSGTTGPSKGVLMPWGQLHAGTLLSAAGVSCGPGEKKTMYVSGPPNHVQAKGAVAAMAQLRGKAVLRHAFSGSQFWNDVRAHGVTDASLVGAMAQFLLAQPPRPDDVDTTLGNVLMAPVIPAVDEFNRRFGTQVWSAYNMTEISVPTWLQRWEEGDEPNCGPVREGYPHYELRIVDEHDYPVAPGVVGELILRTSAPWTLNAGYLNMPEATSSAWRNGWFHTGDAFRQDEKGRYHFVDRMKDAIRRRGENISSFEIEGEVILNPDVSECAAIAVRADEVEDEIKVVVVPTPGSDLTPDELTRYLQQRLPSYMVPRYLKFVDELPKTPTLRVQKSLISRSTSADDGVWDRTAAQEGLADR